MIEVDINDTVFDINSKLFDLQMMHLSKLISVNFNIEIQKSLLSQYNSQKAVSDEVDEKVIELFEDYKQQYTNIVEKYIDL